MERSNLGVATRTVEKVCQLSNPWQKCSHREPVLEQGILTGTAAPGDPMLEEDKSVRRKMQHRKAAMYRL